MSNLRIEDEHGVSWRVESGDPARVAVNTLKRRGYRWVVLPREFLRGMIEPVKAPEPSSDNLSDYRLYDCMEELSSCV